MFSLSAYLVVVKSEDGPEEGVGVGVALVDQGQVQLDQNLFDVQTEQSRISFADYKNGTKHKKDQLKITLKRT